MNLTHSLKKQNTQKNKIKKNISKDMGSKRLKETDT